MSAPGRPAARRSIGVLTSGGDAPGMNAAVRAVARTALHLGADVYAIQDGFQGAVDGGERIRPMHWGDASGIQHRGGTVLGTARCPAFRERAGLRVACRNLVRTGIDRLVVIGGDGSLSGADELAQEWPSLLTELVAEGELTAAQAAAHPALMIAGLVGSIDNDLVGTDMTIGADSALHRITEAIDALSSTAASHHRTFVIEVMGRRCGYLALTAALAGGCDYAFIPEAPPEPNWPEALAGALRRARASGRRDSMVIVAEGARDSTGARISTEEVRSALEASLGEDTRVTILGHVQRGGTPSAFDRSMATMMGYAAVEELLAAGPGDPSFLVGLRKNRVRRAPLRRSVERNRAVAATVDSGAPGEAMQARGQGYAELVTLLQHIANPRLTRAPRPGNGDQSQVQSADAPSRIGVLHAGGLAPGMNAAVRAAVRLGHGAGHEMVGIRGGFAGLPQGDLDVLTPELVDGWTRLGGAELGSRRGVLQPRHLPDLAAALTAHRIDALLVIGGFDAFESALLLSQNADALSALAIPIACVPATIDNNLPATELTIGSDTALNTIVEQVDRIKQSAMAARRSFVIETMGRECGYLALLSAMSTGAEQVLLPEEGITLQMLAEEIDRMTARFEAGHPLHLTIRGEGAHPDYTTDVIAGIFAAESAGRYDVRQTVLGHTQQGGDPSPFDRILAVRFAAQAIDDLTTALRGPAPKQGSRAVMIGLVRGATSSTPLALMPELVDWNTRRPLDQWWLGLRRIARSLAEPAGSDQSASSAATT